MPHASPSSPETIVAIATPPGRGGIGVVRLSGPEALSIARSFVKIRREPESHRAHYGRVVDSEGRVLDDALLTWFAAPRSYTGEDVVEISTHGSPVVLQTVVQVSIECGARLAHAGEFTERAFLNGRLDLSEAEAVRDLIDSSTVAQARLAAEQMGGSLGRELRPIKDSLVQLIAALEAGIDFAEDDLETMPTSQITGQIHALLPPLHRLLASFAHGRLLREGLSLALVGKPNAGKSSLFNALLGRDRAIVTPVAGTTRDVIGEDANIDGVPVRLLDTAGLRETDDPVERIGVERSHEAIAEADLILHVVDASDRAHDPIADPAANPDPLTPPLLHAVAKPIQVWNKSDLLAPDQRNRKQERIATDSAVFTSAITGEGIADLRSLILARAGAGQGSGNQATLTNLRQRDSISSAIASLGRASAALKTATPHEMLLLDLYEALQHLDALTGQTTADDVLNRIFSTFCIGK